MSDISQLAPQPLWRWFEKICSFPRPSGHEAALSQYIQQWAKEHQLEVVVEEVGNLIIRKAATPGMENRKPVVIQAHMDMVPQKNADKVHDFTKDPIEPWIDGDWVKAKGTTLGADNGIGMCSALAILESRDIAHGPLEVLLTVDEESGMSGAFGLQPGVLQGEILINTDSEQEGEIYMGCAGGVDAAITLPVTTEAATSDSSAFRLMLSGLKGGHSGANIHLGRGNANKLLARFLFEKASDLQLQLVDFQGGTLRNAIPREADAGLVVPNAQVDALQQAVAEYEALLRSEFAIADPDMQLTLSPMPVASEVMSAQTQQQLLALLNACPNGVMRMSDEVEGVTETSLNLGVVSIENQQATALCLVRSLIDSGRDYVCSQLSSLATLAGAKITFNGAYPGWKPDNHSPVMAIVRDTYQSIYHKEPVIMVIHAGLECGLFKQPYPDMDMVSIGPTIRFPHSPDEKVNITTVGQYWQLLLAVLQRIPEKA
ncbi:aminoacyl-histidine dipeptidase [Shewanella sp. YIC-542]|uniref:aminoacyl-histidine dipeptidase n=1 Tax=Shewanella mytili TaxID=3377111 RepID=UPI00398F1A7B